MIFADRNDAGRKLSALLARFRAERSVVLALPRGGVVIGAEVANSLHAPLGLVIVKKIGHPLNSEYAIGALAEKGAVIVNREDIPQDDEEWLAEAEQNARAIIEKRRHMYYEDDLEPPVITDKVAIIVDDGIATGLTMEAAIRSVRAERPEYIVAAVPVAPADSVRRLERLADEVVVMDNPALYQGAVGEHYLSFVQVSDEEVKQILREVRDGIYKTVA